MTGRVPARSRCGFCNRLYWLMLPSASKEKEHMHMQARCERCGRPCELVTVDRGIGSYEYGGARGCQIKLVEVSVCCESSVEIETQEPTQENQ